MDRARDERVAALVRDRNAIERVAMSVIRRAVQRVDDPAFVARARPRATFFAEDRALWELRAESIDDQPFARAIGRGHEVAADAFLADVERSAGEP